MRKISLILAIIMVFSVFATCISVNAETTENTNYDSIKLSEAPTVDGEIEEGEYEGAALFEFGTSDLKYYGHNYAMTELWDDTAVFQRTRIGDSKVYIAWTEEGLYVAADIADSTISIAARNSDWGNWFMFGDDQNQKGLCGDTFTLLLRSDGNAINYKQDPGDEGYQNMLAFTAVPFPREAKNAGDRSGSVAPFVAESWITHSIQWDIDVASQGFTDGYVVEYFISNDQLASYKTENGSYPFTGLDQFADGGQLYFTVLLSDGYNNYAWFPVTVGASTLDYNNSRFGGLSADDNAADKTKSQVEFVLNSFAKENKTITFSAGKKCTVTFDCDNGVPLLPIEVTAGTELDLSKYTSHVNGYNFLGWGLDEEDDTLSTTVTVEDDMTLYAKFDRHMNKYTCQTKNAVAPESDGEISEGEYDGALVYSFNGNDLQAYGNNAARTWFAHFGYDKIVEQRGSEMIGESTIYALPTADGIYFAFDIADTTTGGNYVRDIQWHQGMFNGDAVHVIFKSSEEAINASNFADGSAIRFSVAPFKNDFNGNRAVNIVSCVNNNMTDGQYNIIDTTYLLDESASANEEGYVVEFFVGWDMLDDNGFTGLTEWEDGGKLYLNFELTDALGRRATGGVDYAICIIPVDGSFAYNSLCDQIEEGYVGFTPNDKYNWYDFSAYEGEEITLVDDDEPVEFSDLKAGEYYVEPIYWAVKKGITNGTSTTTFEPDAYCTRGQIVTFIWRAMGCPEPITKTNNFVDVKAGEYYEKAVIWAVENGITDGVDPTHFDPNGICTRAQAVTFMYRAAGKPIVTAQNKFVDIPAGEWFTEAVIWASELGITNGTDATHFSPDDFCTRGQIVTFLFRNLATPA